MCVHATNHLTGKENSQKLKEKGHRGKNVIGKRLRGSGNESVINSLYFPQVFCFNVSYIIAILLKSKSTTKNYISLKAYSYF